MVLGVVKLGSMKVGGAGCDRGRSIGKQTCSREVQRERPRACAVRRRALTEAICKALFIQLSYMINKGTRKGHKPVLECCLIQMQCSQNPGTEVKIDVVHKTREIKQRVD